MAYIDRDKAIAYVEEQYRLFRNEEDKQAIIEGCVEALKFTSIADVVEVKHGYWKDRYGNKYINHLYECSVCSKEALFESYKNELDQWNERQALTPVCPHCGAEMDGERKHSN